MRELVYKCKKPFTGEVKIELPKYTQRLKYIKECNFRINADGEIDEGIDQVDSLIKMIEVAGQHIKSVKVKHESGIEVKSYEEMEDFTEFDSLVSELASFVLNGGQVGKS